ncbi:ubiquinol-cytochrome C chaperone family protein [Oryzicola mucosus]|uniref:Ubiquinol-cytochrome C chaperone n=1 Tax=Oryzicola mucosus TaxID=2767425 RepID=A0A8J6U141_9HYPH|nr:ubiquinol-cytochrome C chaperone family protein [Oryzicola mucosus]MBD0416576.1 ubiquinol-cytochrome C chaperone [Oryzicola mucosus]
MFKSLFSGKNRANRAITDALYAEIVAAARQPAFYSHWQVPDSPLGRFEMLSLHMFLLQHRLRDENGAAREVAQNLIDEFFLDVDHSLREFGIGDAGVPKRMKKLARMFYGRTASYADAIDASDAPALAAALARNVRPEAKDWPESAELADYVFRTVHALANQRTDDICSGRLNYAEANAGQESDA